MSSSAPQNLQQDSFNPVLTTQDIQLSDAARQKMTELFGQIDDNILAIRIYVAGGGCSGMRYGMSFAEAQTPYDCVLDEGDYKIFVDAVAMNFMRGVEIDFVERPMGEASFVFNNVFAATGGSGACGGCGSAQSG